MVLGWWFVSGCSPGFESHTAFSLSLWGGAALSASGIRNQVCSANAQSEMLGVCALPARC